EGGPHPPGPRALSELREKPRIVLEQHANVGDSVPEHGDPLHPEAEREARVALRIDPAVLEHARVDHAAAEDLEPARRLAHSAGLPGPVLFGAEDAAHVHLGAGLD